MSISLYIFRFNINDGNESVTSVLEVGTIPTYCGAEITSSVSFSPSSSYSIEYQVT